MSVEAESSITINCSPEEVFAVITDVAGQPNWSKGVGKVQDLSQTPAILGTTWTQVTQFMGKEIAAHGKVNVYELNRKFGSTVDKPFPATMLWQVEPDGSGSKVTVGMVTEPGGFFGTVGAPLIGKGIRDNFTADLARLKAYVEHRS